MNMKMFVDSLNQGEVAELWLVLADKRDAEARRRALPLSEDMKILVRAGEYIAAIKEYRFRIEGSSLLEAKAAVDAYAASLPKRSY